MGLEVVFSKSSKIVVGPLFFQISRVLHKRLVHSGQKTDLPVLQREGGPEENLLESLGETAHALRATVGLDKVARGVAAPGIVYSARNKLRFGS